MSKRPETASATMVATVYFVVAGLWILFSDKILSYFVGDPADLTAWQTAKGWGFVTLTALILFGMVSRSLRTLGQSEERLRQSNEALTVTNEELIATEEELRQRFEDLLVTEARIRRQNECLTALHETALALMNHLNVEDMLEVILQKAMAIGESENGFIYLLSPDGTEMELRIRVGEKFKKGLRQKRDEGIVGRVWESGSPQLIHHYNTWEGRTPEPENDSIETVLALPLSSGGEVFGVFGLSYLTIREVPEEDFELFGNFAELAAIALSNARLHSRLSEELEERRRIEAAWRENQQRSKALVDALPDFIFHVDKEGILLQYKETVDFEMSANFADHVGENIDEFTPPLLAEKIRLAVHQALQTKTTQQFEYHVEIAGVMRHRELRIVASGGNEAIGIVRDMTQHRRVEEELIYVNIHDATTGLFNRAYFEEALQGLSAEGEAPVGVIVCDIDGLKLVNDTLGLEAGDRLLTGAAKIIRDTLPEAAIVARIGGDEFAALLPGADVPRLEQVNKAIRDTAAAYSETADIPLSISVGLAARTLPQESLSDAFKIADNNMYREKLHRNQSVRSAIVNTLAKALEARDFVTDGHADRLQDLAEKLAVACGLAESQLPDLRLLGRFHDIGKVGIPDQILFKPGRLTAEEFEIMKRHSEIGYRIALASPELAPIADWILKHQEWWNGKGYPTGAAGEDIPLACRIVSIVDAYDAMTNDRPYRKAMPHEAAIAELKRCSGTQFDPRLVDIFAEIMG